MRTKLVGFGCGLASGIFWGLDAVLIGLAMTFINVSDAEVWVMPIVVVALHDSFSALWMLAGMICQRRLSEIWRHLRSRYCLIMVLAALCGGPLGMTCYALAIHFIGPALTAIVSAMYPALGALFAVLLGRDKFTWHMLLGLALAIGATIALSYEPVHIEGLLVMGLLLAVLCAVGWGMECVICSYGFSKDIPADIALQIRQLVSGAVYLFLIIPLLCAQGMLLNLFHMRNLLLGLAAVALVGTLSYLFYYKAIAAIGPIRGMGLNITYSAWAAVFSAFILHIDITVFSALTCLAIIMGSMLTAVDPSVLWAQFRRWEF